MQSCHTAKVGDYIVEGHVPADLVKRMLDEQPDIKGLRCQACRWGRREWKGPRKDPYNVIAVGNDGSACLCAEVTPQVVESTFLRRR